MGNSHEIMAALSAPFDPADVKFKPQAVNGNRAMAVAYVTPRAVMDRLDDVLGVMGWADDYEVLPDNSVVCRLRLKLGDEWVTKVDVGGPSEQPDGGDRMKAAFSDALKRAAVKWGVGRYLYRLPASWVDYDPQKRQIVKLPTLPAWAIPSKQVRREVTAAAAPTPARGATASTPAGPAPTASTGSPTTITQEQGEKLKSLLTRTNTKWSVLAGSFGNIERMGQMKVEDFPRAVKMLEEELMLRKMLAGAAQLNGAN